MLGDQARAEMARKHKEPDAFTFSSTDQASRLPHFFSNPRLWPELLASPMGHLQTSLPSLGPWTGTRPPCTDSVPGWGGSLFISAATWGVRGRGRDKATSSKRPPGSPEGWSPHFSGVRTWSGFKYLPMVHTHYLTMDPVASISTRWGKLKS